MQADLWKGWRVRHTRTGEDVNQGGNLCSVTWQFEQNFTTIYGNSVFSSCEETFERMAQGQVKKPGSLLAKGNKKKQTAKLSKGGMFP